VLDGFFAEIAALNPAARAFGSRQQGDSVMQSAQVHRRDGRCKRLAANSPCSGAFAH